MLEILCSVKPEMPAQVKHENKFTKEQLSLVLDLRPLDGEILMDSGYRVLIRRYKEY